jgi:para-aminobenzoate synthetase/4-amino-4-deoxychorismate lyase
MNRWHSPPAELYSLVEQTPASILLECARPVPSDPAAGSQASSMPGSHAPSIAPRRDSCHTRLFSAPLSILKAHHRSELPALFAQIESAVAAGFYAAGYFAYECGAFFEPTAAAVESIAANLQPSQPSSTQPLAWFGIYNRPALFNHHTGEFLHGESPLRGLPSAPEGANPPCPGLSASPSGIGGQPPATLQCFLDCTERDYALRVHAILEKIRAGDIYQLNFTCPLHVHAPVHAPASSAAALYRRLRARQPAPYAAFLHTEPDQRILSLSPELFFHVQIEEKTRRITTRPMKGTAPRGRTTAEDRASADFLRHDPKNRAENVMIVDLLRNDLGRICNYGTVETRDLFAVERYPTLWQMTSTVTGELRPGVTFQQILRALFPSGSVTGAPKVRAMQLISQLESAPRGVYTGAIGFFSPQESIFSVAIRTLSLNGDTGSMGVGSGIVIDSDPAAEWAECKLKAQFLTQPDHRLPADFSLIETLLWDGGYPLIELHLGRLADSAAYFGFPCERWEVRAALVAEEVSFHDRRPRKVRLLLSPDGALHITSEILPEKAPDPKPLRVTLSPHRTDPLHPMFFHKTTHRPLYIEAFAAAKQAGYDEVLFLNDRGEVTECSNHNIFIERAARLITPPVECGLIPGVHRQLILQTHPTASQRRLTLYDLRHADAVFLSNAVRGLRPAVIVWES